MKVKKEELQETKSCAIKKPPRIAYFFMKIVLKLRRNRDKINKLLISAGMQKGMKILDYGCGIGSYAFEAAKITGKSGKVIAADINESMLKTLKKEIATASLSNISAQKVDSLKDIHEKDFDFIFLIDVLHMMDNQAETINYFLNRLADNGKLLIKFEHINNERINRLLKKCNCSVKKNTRKNPADLNYKQDFYAVNKVSGARHTSFTINKDFWILGN